MIKGLQRKISYFWHYDVLSGKRIKFAKIIVLKEPMVIRNLKFTMDNVYNVPAKDVGNEKVYSQPLDNPKLNINNAFHIYRKKMGLLSPKQIRQSRKIWGLSQPEVAFILGISYSTLSKIENNHIIQSVSQDTQLRSLLNGNSLSRLILVRLPVINIKHPRGVKINDLTKVVKRVNNYNQSHKFNAIKQLPIKDMIDDYCSKRHYSEQEFVKLFHLSYKTLKRITEF